MKTTLSVNGMSCGHCVRAVTEALEGIEGVTEAKVSLDAGRAEVEHDAGVSADVLIAAVRDEGYGAERVAA